jgi:hypothetical protein
MNPTKFIRLELLPLTQDHPLKIPVHKPVYEDRVYLSIPNTTITTLITGNYAQVILENTEATEQLKNSIEKVFAQLIIEVCNDPTTNKANQKKSLGYYRNHWIMAYAKILSLKPLTFICQRENYTTKFGMSVRPVRVKI